MTSPTGDPAGGPDTGDHPDPVLDALVEVPPHAPPWWAPFTLAAFLGLVVCTNIANVVWARWANNNPEGLIALSSRQRYLVLAVAGGVSPFWYVVIGTVRIAAAFLVCHFVGRAYREQALSWFTRYLGMSRGRRSTRSTTASPRPRSGWCRSSPAATSSAC